MVNLLQLTARLRLLNDLFLPRAQAIADARAKSKYDIAVAAQAEPAPSAITADTSTTVATRLALAASPPPPLSSVSSSTSAAAAELAPSPSETRRLSNAVDKEEAAAAEGKEASVAKAKAAIAKPAIAKPASTNAAAGEGKQERGDHGGSTDAEVPKALQEEEERRAEEKEEAGTKEGEPEAGLEESGDDDGNESASGSGYPCAPLRGVDGGVEGGHRDRRAEPDTVAKSSPSTSGLSAPQSPDAPTVTPTAAGPSCAATATATTRPSSHEPLLTPEQWEDIDHNRYNAYSSTKTNKTRSSLDTSSASASLSSSPSCAYPREEGGGKEGGVATTAGGGYSSSEVFELTAEEVKAAGRLKEGDLLRADVEALLLRCVNADPNYGSMWFHCRHRPSDTAK